MGDEVCWRTDAIPLFCSFSVLRSPFFFSLLSVYSLFLFLLCVCLLPWCLETKLKTTVCFRLVGSSVFLSVFILLFCLLSPCFLFLFPLSLCSSGALCLCLSSSVYGPLCCLSSPLRGLFSGFYCQRMPSVRAYWGWGIAAGRRGPWLKRFWCLNCWNGSWGRRRWIVFETALFVSWKWLFSICPMNVWHLIIGPLFKENFLLLFFFFNFSPGSNWNWTPEFQCHLQTSH